MRLHLLEFLLRNPAVFYLRFGAPPLLLGFTELLLQHFLGADHDLLLVDVDFLLYLHLQLSLDLVQPRFQVLCL